MYDCLTKPWRNGLLQIQSNGLTALQRLDTHLASLGESLARLEKGQADSVKHAQEILDAVYASQSSLQVHQQRPPLSSASTALLLMLLVV